MCPFGKDCFYKHAKEDGTPYLFIEGVDESMRVRNRVLADVLYISNIVLSYM